MKAGKKQARKGEKNLDLKKKLPDRKAENRAFLEL